MASQYYKNHFSSHVSFVRYVILGWLISLWCGVFRACGWTRKHVLSATCVVRKEVKH
jgi:hypothetical protein